MPGCIVSATTASFRSVEKRRLRATPVITSTLENVSDIGVCLGLSLGPPASAGVRSKRGALHLARQQAEHAERRHAAPGQQSERPGGPDGADQAVTCPREFQAHLLTVAGWGLLRFAR